MIKKFFSPKCDTPYFVQTKEEVGKCAVNKGIFVAITLFILTLIVLFSQKDKLNKNIIMATLVFSLVISFIIIYLYKLLNSHKWEAVQIIKEYLDKSEFKECDKLRVLEKSKPSELDILFYFFFGVYVLGWIILIFGIKIDVQQLITKNLIK